MALRGSYVIWNNKGGVGKSTITFHLATRYAELNPDCDVLVIDLCPQGNASMMLLGGGTVGEQAFLAACTATPPSTVVGYLSTIITNGPGAPLPDPMNFLIQPNQQNGNITGNLFLLCGDGNLEPMGPAITDAANARPLTPQSRPWAWVHEIFRRFITSFVNRPADRDVCVFIDTNPSFGIYTELAITAGDKLIVPVNADDSSRTAAHAMTVLLHGTTPPHPIYGSWTFAAQAAANGTNVPLIHLVVGNRLTQFMGAAKGFQALSQATSQALYGIYQQNPGYFTPPQQPINSIGDFIDYYSEPLRDFNTAGVVSAHLGQRLSLLASGYYTVHGAQVKVNKEKVEECLDAVDAVMAML